MFSGCIFPGKIHFMHLKLQPHFGAERDSGTHARRCMRCTFALSLDSVLARTKRNNCCQAPRRPFAPLTDHALFIAGGVL